VSPASSSPADVVLRCEGFGKVYRSGFFRVPYVGLEDLTLAVRRGEIFGFIGPNGAGKTTAIKCLMGVQAATSGRAELLGKDHRDPESKRGVGFLPERPYFYEHLTAREFLHFYGSLFGLPKAVRAARIDELLARVQLERFADVPLRAYSKGMLQRAGVAQALINDPELLVLDEPMSGLDPMGRLLIRDLIFEERRRGRTVFFSSHILADVELICDRVAILVGGRLRGLGTVRELVGDRVKHVDIATRVHNIADADLPGELIRRDGDAVILRVGPDDADRAIDTLRAAGASILSVTPAREHLESVLLDEVQRAAPINQKHLGVLA
jgi:ABC-2 type transport system ATP-binding protein